MGKRDEKTNRIGGLNPNFKLTTHESLNGELHRLLDTKSTALARGRIDGEGERPRKAVIEEIEGDAAEKPTVVSAFRILNAARDPPCAFHVRHFKFLS